MSEQRTGLTNKLPRQTIQLMLELSSRLRQHGLKLSLTMPNIMQHLIQASESVEDKEIQTLRQRLIHMQASNRLHTLSGTTHDPENSSQDQPIRKTVYPHDSGAGLLKCDQCQGAITVKADQRGETPSSLVRCACGIMYEVIIELRRSPRIPTQLQGSYVNLAKPGQEGEIVVEDLSLGGVRFRTSAPHAIVCNDHLHIQFVLDDEYHTFIWQKINVRYVRHRTIGAEFIEEGNSNKALKAFLSVRQEVITQPQ